MFKSLKFSSCACPLVALAVALSFATGSAVAQQPTDVVSIEEHWELQVGGPQVERCAPQVTMVMSPTSSIDDHYFTVTLNHWMDPDFSPGGVQAQQWCGDECFAATNSHARQVLSSEGETISWVQRLSLENDILKFEVVDGASQTWGTFGADGEMALTESTTLSRLNDYKPAISIGESGIGYAGNRVSSLVLKRIRWVTADGEEHELVAPIDIDTDLDP